MEKDTTSTKTTSGDVGVSDMILETKDKVIGWFAVEGMEKGLRIIHRTVTTNVALKCYFCVSDGDTIACTRVPCPGRPT